MFHQLIYSFTKKVIEKGDIVLKKGQATDKLILVELGRLEMICQVDDIKNFKIMDIGRGCFINYTNIFLDF